MLVRVCRLFSGCKSDPVAARNPTMYGVKEVRHVCVYGSTVARTIGREDQRHKMDSLKRPVARAKADMLKLGAGYRSKLDYNANNIEVRD